MLIEVDRVSVNGNSKEIFITDTFIINTDRIVAILPMKGCALVQYKGLEDFKISLESVKELLQCK